MEILRIGRYEAGEVIAQGGMGIVLRAHDPELRRDVAVKLLRSDRGESPQAKRRFMRECRALAKVRHPGIVPCLQVGEHEGAPYLVMQLVEGRSLQERIDAEGPLPVGEAVGMAIAIGEALRKAHEQGVLHRDIKPDNVLLAKDDGRVLLADFGLAKLTGPGQSQSWSLSIKGRFLGTPGYWPPEQARGLLEEIGPHSDVYGLGATLYVMLTGHPPHEGESFVDLVEAASQAPVVPRKRRGEVSRALSRLVMRCLAREPGERPSLDGLLAELADPAVRKGSSRTRTLAWVAGALALGISLFLTAFGIGGLAFDPGGEPREVEETAVAAGGADLEVPRTERAAEARRLLAEALELSRQMADFKETRGRFERAQDVAPSLDPIRAEIGLELCRFLSRRGRYEETEAMARRLSGERGRVGLEAMLLQGYALEGQANPNDTLAVLRELARVDPEGVAGLTAKLVIARFSGWKDFQELEHLFRRVKSLDPEYAPARLERIIYLLRQGLMGESADSLRKGLEEAPDDPRLLAWDGYRLKLVGSPEEGLAQLNLSIRLAGPNPFGMALLWRGEILMGRGELQEAIDDFERALAISPDAMLGLLFLGEACWKRSLRGDGDPWRVRAEEVWRRAQKSDPRRFDSYLLGFFDREQRSDIRRVAGVEPVADRKGEWVLLPTLSRELDQSLRRRVGRAQEPARWPLREALHAAAVGRPWVEVEQLFDHALQVAPDCRVVALEVARVFVGREAYGRAQEQLRHARSLDVSAHELDRLEAELYWQMGKGNEAAIRFEKLMEKDPSGIDGMSARAWFFLAHRRYDDAIEAAERTLSSHSEAISCLALKANLLASNPGGGLATVEEALELTTRALAAGGATSVYLINSRISCQESMLVFKQEAAGKISRKDIEPIFNAYRRVFPITPGPTFLHSAAQLGMQLPDPYKSEALRWLEEAIARDPTRGMSHLLLGQYRLRHESPREEVLAAWRKGREVEPRLLFLPFLLEEYRKRFGPDCPELEEFADPPVDSGQ